MKKHFCAFTLGLKKRVPKRLEISFKGLTLLQMKEKHFCDEMCECVSLEALSHIMRIISIYSAKFDK